MRRSAAVPGAAMQFSLAELFESVTVCSLPLAFAPVLGPATSGLVSAMSLAMWLRQGLAAIGLLMAASLAGDLRGAALDSNTSLLRQLIIAALAAAVCCWYRVRRRGRG